MAFKMKGSSLYGSPLKQKTYSQEKGTIKKETAEKKNEWGETPEQYKKRVADMGLNNDNDKPSPAKGLFGKLLNPAQMLPGKLGELAGKLPGSNI
tara:strand:+ start:124 stop:408 length:285 start_codon:yes stop_codon:yes gene_type:complete